MGILLNSFHFIMHSNDFSNSLVLLHLYNWLAYGKGLLRFSEEKRAKYINYEMDFSLAYDN